MNTVNFDEIKLNDEDRQVCEVWTRVMGYIRPTTEFNVGKKSEFNSRVCFCESKSVEVANEDAFSIAAE